MTVLEIFLDRVVANTVLSLPRGNRTLSLQMKETLGIGGRPIGCAYYPPRGSDETLIRIETMFDDGLQGRRTALITTTARTEITKLHPLNLHGTQPLIKEVVDRTGLIEVKASSPQKLWADDKQGILRVIEILPGK